MVPFRVEDVAPSATLEYFISETHWLDAFPPPLEHHLERLADAVKRLLASKFVQPSNYEARRGAPFDREAGAAQAAAGSEQPLKPVDAAATAESAKPTAIAAADQPPGRPAEKPGAAIRRDRSRSPRC